MGRRVGGLVWRDEMAREMEEEMRLHREAHERELIAGGVDGEEARYAATRAFGNVTAASERGREAWGWRWLEDFVGDLKFGTRMLRKNPGFAATAILTLALGIGANTAIFSVVNTVLLQPLPYRDPGRLVWADEYNPRFNDYAVPNPEYTNWALNNHTFAAMGALGNGGPMNLTQAGVPEQVEGGLMTPSLLEILGVRPQLGRWFTPEEGLPGAANVVLLSDSLWRRKFNADPNIVGKSMTLNQDSYTIVGVMPASFRFSIRGAKPEFIGPFQLPPKVDWAAERMQLTQVIGRLKPGVSLQEARTDLAELSKRANSEIPAVFLQMREGLEVQTVSLHDKLVGDIRPTLLILLIAVGVVLMIACVNIANLQLARTSHRQKELAVRSAIGADRTRLLRQLLTEGVLIAFLGGISGVTVVLFGTVPSIRGSKPDVDARLKDARDTATSGAGQRSLRNALATCELALAVVLVAASGLLLRSFVLLSNVDPGFRADHVLTLSTMLPMAKYSKSDTRNGFYEEALRKLKALPGVHSAGLTTSLPFSPFVMMRAFQLEGQPDKQINETQPTFNEAIDPGYLQTLGVTLLAGREFEEADSKSERNVVLVNQAFVDRYMDGKVKAAVDKRLRFAAGPGEALPWQTIVGVVASVRRMRVDRPAEPEIYVPHGHGDFVENMAGIAIRTDVEPRSLIGAVRDAVLAVDPEQPIFDVKTMEQRVADATSGTRFNATLLGFLGIVALGVAGVGVFGVIAYSVAERTHEIGIRVALGASRGDVAGMVMSQGLAMTAAGLVIGLAGALAVTRYMSGLLYGIAPRDPVTFGVAAMVLAAVAMAACYLPARRAMGVDPMVALRHE